ncbi:bifunctional diguanylate cyclase/phosphodiesterase [Vreelandella olivaria]|uniref:bifunctional diguanylate cyclase/phosphodiesterase n=1 Tax=Vreelandella olivaria TaxID=390919 RepID=UPI00201F70D9|nr:EAL domain-containing protein [Halomonas olivaria]
MSPTTAPEIFRQLADRLSSASKDGFFHHLAHSLATLLHVDHVLVVSIDTQLGAATPLAMSTSGEWLEPLPCALQGTACEQVYRQARLYVPSQVRAQFPNDPLLELLSAEGYLGVAMVDAEGNCQGIIALIHSSPLSPPLHTNEVLKIASSLAGFELSRQVMGAQAQERILSEQRALRLISRGNEALIHARREASLLQAACHILVEVGGYSAAWVSGVVENSAQPLCWVDQATADLQGEVPVWFSPKQLLITSYSRDMAKQALESRAPIVISEYGTDAIAPSLKAALLTLGVKTLIALPLIYRGTAFGVLSFYQTDEPEVTNKELRLVSELADDIAFGLDSVRRRQTEQRIQHAVTQVATAVSAQHGEAFLTQLTAHMADALSAEVGFIATLDEDDAGVANILSLYVDGRQQQGFSYRLAGVPCQEVLYEEECIVHDGAGVRLPVEANGALEWVSAYVGRRLDDANGKPIGIIGVMFRSPLTDTQIVSTVLQIFAVRAASELERKENEARIRQLAFRDEGTLLPNRADFMHYIERKVSEYPATPLALLLLDLNHFKEINDTAGHDLGDLVLKEVAGRFSKVLKEGDYLARLGGDEFIVVCNGEDSANALNTAQHLCESLNAPINIEHHSSELSVSIGISLYPHHACSSQELLKYADIAMYQAKRQKLAIRTFEYWMEQEVSEKLHIAKRLAIAIADNTLTLNFQPQIDMRSGKIIGAEALCRWRDDELGDVSPLQFIPIAEERGMIAALGKCVIENSCRQLAQWRKRGMQLPGQLAINIAADQFEDGDLVNILLTNCNTYGISPAALSLEITESGIMDNPEKAIAMTEVLKGYGLGLAIDDFGTGYSSLSYLKRFAADKIKIDISFIRDMLISDNDHTIVATIIAMANTLGLETIAEGIESKAQVESLLTMGCTQGQGYYFDRPLAADQFAERWLI